MKSTDLRDRIAMAIFDHKHCTSHAIADAVLGVLGDLHADCYLPVDVPEGVR